MIDFNSLKINEVNRITELGILLSS